MQGFLLFNSVSGGTGSGFSSLLLERLSDEYDRKAKLAFSIFPQDENAASVVESYNAVSHLSSLINNVDLSFVLENTAIREICQQRLGIERPSYANLNRLLAQVISQLTISLRHPSDFNIDINEY